jgi:hypothetical protein
LTKHHGRRENVDAVVNQFEHVNEHGGKAGFGDIGGFGLNFFYLIELFYIVIQSCQLNISAQIMRDSALQAKSSPTQSEDEAFLGV